MNLPKVSVDDNHNSVKIKMPGPEGDVQWIVIKGLQVNWSGAFKFVRDREGLTTFDYTVYCDEHALIKGVSRFVLEIYEAQNK